jgi:hypothetical protein
VASSGVDPLGRTRASRKLRGEEGAGGGEEREKGGSDEDGRPDRILRHTPGGSGAEDTADAGRSHRPSAPAEADRAEASADAGAGGKEKNKKKRGGSVGHGPHPEQRKEQAGATPVRTEIFIAKTAVCAESGGKSRDRDGAAARNEQQARTGQLTEGVPRATVDTGADRAAAPETVPEAAETGTEAAESARKGAESAHKPRKKSGSIQEGAAPKEGTGEGSLQVLGGGEPILHLRRPMGDGGDREDRRSRAPKFKGDDYFEWSFLFQQWAEDEDLLGFFDGTADERPNDAGDEQKKWDKLNHRAFAELCTALREKSDLVRLIKDFGMRKEIREPAAPGGARVVNVERAKPDQAWERLRIFHVQASMSSQISLETLIEGLRMEHGESLERYWGRASDLLERLRAAGGNMQDHAWMRKVVRGLPPNWDTLKVVLNRTFATMSKTDLLRELTDEEARQVADGPASALAAWGRGNRNGGKGKQGGSTQGAPQGKVLGRDGAWGELGKAPLGHCHGCHKYGHKWTECKQRPSKDAVPKWVHERNKGVAVAAVPVEQPVFGELALVEPTQVQPTKEGTRKHE